MTAETARFSFRSPQGAPTRICDAFAIAILLIVAGLAFATFDHYGLGWDDNVHAQFGDLLLAFYGSGFSDRRALSYINLFMYGGGFDMAAALLAKALPFDVYATRRLTGAIVGLFGLIATWRTGRLLGGPLAGLIALALLAACPLYYGHMFFNAKDAPFAVAMILLVWALARCFGSYPAPSFGSTAFLGLTLGLTVGTRILGGMASLYGATALALVIAIEARNAGLRPALGRAGQFVLRLLPALPIAYVVMAVLWPWAALSPLNPIRAIGYFSAFFEKPWKELFGGVLIAVPEMPWVYLPTLFALKLPEVLLLLAMTGALTVLWRAARGGDEPRSRAALLLPLCAVVVPLAITLVTRPALYNGIRHFLFLVPPLAVLGGLGGTAILKWLADRSRAAAGIGAVAIVSGLALPVVDMARLHPYEYVHFNRASGGAQAARGRYMLDYWGLSFRQAALALRAALANKDETPPADGKWKVGVCGPHPPAQVPLGSQFEVTPSPAGADFAISLGEFYCERLDAPLIAEIVRDGIAFARVYDIRGKRFETLFTPKRPDDLP